MTSTHFFDVSFEDLLVHQDNSLTDGFLNSLNFSISRCIAIVRRYQVMITIGF